MKKTISLEKLREHLCAAQEKLSLEKEKILDQNPPLPLGSHEEYIFAYVRAERLGAHMISLRLSHLAWLPLQLDIASDLVGDNRTLFRRWLKSTTGITPTADDFGNEFIHALARTALHSGWETPSFQKLALRIADLFHDLSCLLNVLYYCNWLVENSVDRLPLSKPDDLHQTIKELACFMQAQALSTTMADPDAGQKSPKNQREKFSLIDGGIKPPPEEHPPV